MRGLIVLLFALLSGCAPTIRTSILIENDEYKPTITILGPEQIIDCNFGKSICSYYMLRTVIDKKSGQYSHQLYVSVAYFGDWAFFERAYLLGGKELQFAEIERRVIDCESETCKMRETFGATIPPEITKSGFSVRFFSKNGEGISVVYPDSLCSIQNDAIKRVLSSL